MWGPGKIQIAMTAGSAQIMGCVKPFQKVGGGQNRS